MTHDASRHSFYSDRQEQFDEILATLMRAIDAGKAIDLDQWVTRHPEFRAELQKFFAQRERVEKLVQPLRQAATKALHVRCPHCHNPIELLDQAPLTDISCPSCGSSFSLVGDNTVSHYLPGEKTIGHFQLLDRVGVGQFGSVWKARDTKLDRTVAVKIPRHSQLDSSHAELFLRDARAAAQLRHPNIVSVHEVGKHDDTIYIVSDFIQGTTLKEWMTGERLTPRDAAELCAKIAKALHHAHESGVIHRDLKPGNIMMDTNGEPHIVDFGLAKRQTGEITITVEGQILGTPAYMSPEQARGEGHTVDRRADIYSLGVILFEVLTGELPFRGDKQMLLVQILRDNPPSPRKLNSSVPRDLETVCLKSLEKDPNRRYGSANAIENDLHRFVRGETILARPATVLEKSFRWAQRKPAMASLVAVSSVATILIMAGLSIGIALISNALHDRTEALSQLTIEQRNTLRALEQIKKQQQTISGQKDEIQTQMNRATGLLGSLSAAETELQALDEQVGKRQVELYKTLTRLAGAEIRAHRLKEAAARLDEIPADRRNWEWHYYYRLCHPEILTLDDVTAVAFSSTSELIATAEKDSTISIRRILTDEVVASTKVDNVVGYIEWSPNGQHILFISADEVRAWDIEANTVHLIRVGSVRAATFSSDSKEIVTLGGAPACVRSSPFPPAQESPTVNGNFEGDIATFSRGARQLALASDGGVTLWNRQTLEHERLEGASTKRAPSNLRGTVSALAFSNDGKYLAIARGHRLKGENRLWFDRYEVIVWDIEQRIVRHSFATGRQRVQNLAFSVDAKRLAGGAYFAGERQGRGPKVPKSDVYIWDLSTGDLETILPLHDTQVTSLAFNPQGWCLACASSVETKLWDVTSSHFVPNLQGNLGSVFDVDISPNGNLLVAGYGSTRGIEKDIGGIIAWDLASGEELYHRDKRNGHPTENVYSVAFSPDGKLVAAGVGLRSPKTTGRAHVYAAATGEEVFQLEVGSGAAFGVAFSPDGQLLASSSDSVTRIWRLSDRKEINRIRGGTDLRFSPDGRRIAVCGGGTVTLWEIATGKELNVLKASGKRFDFSPDGQRLALATIGRTAGVKVFDVAEGTLLLGIRCPADRWVFDVAFSPNGDYLATANWQSVKLWDAFTGEEIVSLRRSPEGPHQSHASLDRAYAVDFSNDGRRLVAGWGVYNRDNEAQQVSVLVLDTRTGKNSLALQWSGKRDSDTQPSSDTSEP